MTDDTEPKSITELAPSEPLVFEDHVLAFCTKCGETQDGPVSVEPDDQWNRTHNPDKTISEDHHVSFRCENCGIEETVESGLFPERLTENFSTRNPGETTDLRIDEREVLYRSIDEQVVESSYIQYDSTDISTSRMHHLHIHVLNPPTLTQNSAHHVEIEGYLDSDMMLVDIDYHDSKRRTLKFVRGLDKGVLKKLEELRED